MPWGVAASVAGAVVSSELSDKKSGGGAGSSSTSKEPWADAAPWLRDQIKTGQELQTQYQQTPFNAQQLAAYGNMGRQTDYVNNLVPDLLGQVSNQGLLGFDRSNPNRRVTPYTFNGSGNGLAGGAQTGLLANLTNPETVSQYTSAANPPAVAPPAPVAAPAGMFTAYDPAQAMMDARTTGTKATAMGYGGIGAINGGYGSFNYGDGIPQKGTQQYLDYQNFLLAGGDQLGLYANNGGKAGNGGA